MLAGFNNNQFNKDVKYNISQEDLYRITSVKKGLKNKVDQLRKINWSDNPRARTDYYKYANIYNKFESGFIPNIYNQMLGYKQSDGYAYLNQFEEKDSNSEYISESEYIEEIANDINLLSTKAKYEEGTLLEKLTKSVYNQYKEFITIPPTEEEVKKTEEGLSRNTNSEEDSEEEGDNEDSPLKEKRGYKSLKDWLNSLKETTAYKKEMTQIKKVSDLQKVSVVELTRPRALLMNKIINRELYCKQKVKGDRFMHTMIDNSGSMSAYRTWRNDLMETIFNDCKEMNINLENSFWNVHIHEDGPKGPQSIKSENDLKEKVLKIRANGDDCMGQCVYEKLQKIPRKAEMQYLLCISDGTGSIRDSEERKNIERLAKEKNIELKYALFSSQNDMYGTNKDDIYYIY